MRKMHASFHLHLDQQNANDSNRDLKLSTLKFMTHVPVCLCIAEEKNSWSCLQWFPLLSLRADVQVG